MSKEDLFFAVTNEASLDGLKNWLEKRYYNSWTILMGYSS